MTGRSAGLAARRNWRWLIALAPAVVLAGGLGVALVDRSEGEPAGTPESIPAANAEEVSTALEARGTTEPAPPPEETAAAAPQDDVDDGDESPPPVQVDFLPAPSPTATPDSSPVEKLPDLRPLRDFMANYHTGSDGATTTLRFDTGFGNFGLGAFEMHGGRETADDEMTAYQRIYWSDGSTRDVAAGTLEYKDSHLHWHITDLALYELLDEDGEVLLSSNKAGFCLIDTYFVDPRPPDGPDAPEFYFCTTGSEDTLVVTSFGLSSGWYDVYEAWLPEQELDVTGLEPGVYQLRVTVDANERIRESDETNNTITADVILP